MNWCKLVQYVYKVMYLLTGFWETTTVWNRGC